MARLTICNACELGDHDHHRRVVQVVPEGMMGGSVCRCEGECRDGRYKREYIPKAIRQAIMRAAQSARA